MPQEAPMPIRVKIHFADGSEPLETVFDGSQVRIHKMPEICAVYDATHIEILGAGPDA